jgi:3-oxoacyl-[acyl-carrier-protein] synthase II
MADTARRAVITGMGVVAPLGLDLATFWEALCSRRSGVRPLHNIEIPEQFPTRIGGEIDNFDARNYLDKKDRKRLPVMARTFQLAVAAARMAVQHAGITPHNVDPTRLGTVVGSGTIPSDLVELGRASLVTASAQLCHTDLKKWGPDGMPLISPMWMLSYIPNMLGCHVSIVHNAQGPSNTITQTDTSGMLALGEAWRLIRHNKADVVLVGSSDAKVNAVSLVRQSLFTPLSQRFDAPERACRPFDRGRDGIVLGEGGGILVLEDLEHARRRGATIHAEVVGFASTLDRSVDRGIARWPSGAPRERSHFYPKRNGPNGLVRAARAALTQAGIALADLDHINAQGYSTIPDDAWEAQALAEVFGVGTLAIPVFAPKSYFGALGAGSSSVELIASLLALHHGTVPATLNYDEPDPACPVNVLTEPRRVRRPHFLKVAFSELGQVAIAVCRRWE